MDGADAVGCAGWLRCAGLGRSRNGAGLVFVANPKMLDRRRGDIIHHRLWSGGAATNQHRFLCCGAGDGKNEARKQVGFHGVKDWYSGHGASDAGFRIDFNFSCRRQIVPQLP